MLCAKCKDPNKTESDFWFNAKKNSFHVWCRVCSAEYARGRRKKKKTEGNFCSGCLVAIDEGKQCHRCKNRYVNKEKHLKVVNAYRIRNPEYAKEAARKRKTIILSAYGNKCQCCSEDKFEFLTIDHENGGGHQHRKEVKNMYSWLIRNAFPSGFRTLCMNCNFALGRYGYCPHQKERAVAA